jgi:transposase
VLADHPRWVVHFTPTSASWINAVEGFFSIITRRRIRRGVFTSVANLQDAIRSYIRNHHRNPKPFIWTKPADIILAKVSRVPVASN